MRRTLSSLLILLAACAGGSSSGGDQMPAPAAASGAVDPNDPLAGNWQVAYEADGAPRQFILSITANGNGSYTGTASGDTPMGFRIRRISRNGNSMVLDASTDRDLVTMRVQGTASQMQGTFMIGRATGRTVMTRVP